MGKRGNLLIMQMGIKICVFMFWFLPEIQLPKNYLFKLFIIMRIKYSVTFQHHRLLLRLLSAIFDRHK